MDTEMTKKRCEQCKEEQLLSAFYRTKNSKDGHMKTCIVCHKANLQRSKEAQQAAQEQYKQAQAQAKAQRLQELQEQQEQARAKNPRYQQLKAKSANTNTTITQVDCASCGKLVDLLYQPSEDALSWIRCTDCQETQRAERHKEFQMWATEQKENPRPPKERQIYCVVCGTRKGHRAFPWGLDGYRFFRSYGNDGMTLYISCTDCLETLASLPLTRQRSLIQLGCKRAYGDYQAVYKLTDPETKQIRYVGRTNNLKDRYRSHLKNISSTPHYHHVASVIDGTYTYGIDRTRPPVYTRSNWIYDLSVKELKPGIDVLYEPSPAPLIIEWEQRYILHGLQQGWPLTNLEHEQYNLHALQDPNIDFLHDPFEKLLKLAFFQEDRLEAFIRKWYRLPA